MAELTQEQSKPIEKGVSEVKTTLAQISTGIKSLQDIDMSKAPPLDANNGELSSIFSGTINSVQGEQTAFQTALEKAMAQTQQTESQATKGIISALPSFLQKKQKLIEQRPSTAEIIKTTMEQLGFPMGQLAQDRQAYMQRQQTLVGQIMDYQKQIVDLEAVKQTRLLNAEQQFQGYLTLALRGEQNLIERTYNSRIMAKAAAGGLIAQTLQMERAIFQDSRQAFQDAMNMTDKIVRAMTYDYEQKVNDFEWVFDTFSDLFNTMDSEEEKQWNRSYKLSKDDLDRKRREFEFDINKRLERERISISLFRATKSDILPPTSFNIRAGLVGLDKEQANDIFISATSPDWFKQSVENEFQQSITPDVLQDMWNRFTEQVKEKAEEAAESGGIQIEINAEDIKEALE